MQQITFYRYLSAMTSSQFCCFDPGRDARNEKFREIRDNS